MSIFSIYTRELDNHMDALIKEHLPEWSSDQRDHQLGSSSVKKEIKRKLRNGYGYMKRNRLYGMINNKNYSAKVNQYKGNQSRFEYYATLNNKRYQFVKRGSKTSSTFKLHPIK